VRGRAGCACSGSPATRIVPFLYASVCGIIFGGICGSAGGGGGRTRVRWTAPPVATSNLSERGNEPRTREDARERRGSLRARAPEDRRSCTPAASGARSRRVTPWWARRRCAATCAARRDPRSARQHRRFRRGVDVGNAVASVSRVLILKTHRVKIHVVRLFRMGI
jgi:hypothetical protein